MARLRRSKLAAGFLLLFQCLSERCQLGGGETPRQNRGKRGRYLPGGAGPGSAAERGAARPGGGGSGSGSRAAFPQHRHGVGSAGSSAGRASGEGKRRLGVVSRCSRGRPGVAAVPAFHTSLPRRLQKELSITSFIYFDENSGLSSFNRPAPRSPGAGTVPLPSAFAGSPEPLSQPCTRRSRRRRGPTQAPGREGRRHQLPREPQAAGSGGPGRPGDLPPPARGGAPLLSRQRAVEGEAKFPRGSCVGELAGTLLPRGSQ